MSDFDWVIVLLFTSVGGAFLKAIGEMCGGGNSDDQS